MTKKIDKKKTKIKKPRSKHVGPFLHIGKKKHPFGKPIEAHFWELRIWVSMGYMTQIGLTKEGQIGFGTSKPNDLTIFFQDKEHSGSLMFDEKTGKNLYEALKKLYDTDKKGNVKKTYAGITITKYQRYKDPPIKKPKKKVK